MIGFNMDQVNKCCQLIEPFLSNNLQGDHLTKSDEGEGEACRHERSFRN